MQTTVRELLDIEAPRKKEKSLRLALEKTLAMVDDRALRNFVDCGYKSLRDFILDSSIIWEAGDFQRAAVESYYFDMLECENYDDFFGYHNLESFEYTHRAPSAKEIAERKEKIRDKIIGDLANYVRLVDYFIYNIGNQLTLLAADGGDSAMLEYSINRIVREWLAQEQLNGIFLVLDILRDSELLNRVTELLDYLSPTENNELRIEVGALRDKLLSLERELDRQKHRLGAAVERIMSGQDKVYRMPVVATMMLGHAEEKTIFTPAGLEKIYPRESEDASKLLRLFLREYAQYLFTDEHRKNFGSSFVAWFGLYQRINQDDDLSGVLSFLRQERGKSDSYTAAAESYADLFELYYYNLFSKGTDTFYELNREKPFVEELMEYLGQTREKS